MESPRVECPECNPKGGGGENFRRNKGACDRVWNCRRRQRGALERSGSERAMMDNQEGPRIVCFWPLSGQLLAMRASLVKNVSRHD